MPPRPWSGFERMPVNSRFLGIAAAIPYSDHDPPYFNATYGEQEITVGIRDVVVTGRFPRRALAHVLEKAELHRDELEANSARAREPLVSHAPRSKSRKRPKHPLG